MTARLLPLCGLLAACNLQPGDCRYFDEPCEAFEPQGLDCGIANTLAEHLGGSCHGEFDPAFVRANNGTYGAAENQSAPCPDGMLVEEISDHEVGSRWDVCAAEGRSGNTGMRLADVPAGAACGLSVVGTPFIHTCMGAFPSRAECPDGFRFRWVPDNFYDLLGEDYHSTPDGKLTPGADLVTFCEPVEESGCTEGDCPDYLDRRGILCGLHARNLDEFQHVSETSIRDLSEILESFIRPASAFFPDVAAILPEVEDAVYGPDADPRCMGKPVRDGCPAGLGLVCTADWFSTTAYAPFALCWCDDPDSAQSLAE